MGRRLQALAELMQTRGTRRPASTAFERALGRGTAMLTTWAPGQGTVACLREACRLAAGDPRPFNALAFALVRADGNRHLGLILQILQQACAMSDSYVPAALNLAYLLQASSQLDQAARAWSLAEQRLAGRPAWQDLDGPTLPVGFGDGNVYLSLALGTAIRARQPDLYAAALGEQPCGLPSTAG